MWNTSTLCHPLWRLVAINCLMFHARTDIFRVCFRKLFFPKAYTNSRRTKFTFRWKRFASHASYECALVTFPHFFPPDNQLAPQLFCDRVRAVTHVVCGKIFTLWSALCPDFPSGNERVKMGRKYYGALITFLLRECACVQVRNNGKISLYLFCFCTIVNR